MRLGTTNNEERTMINENFKTNYDLAEAVVRAGNWFRAVGDMVGDFEPVAGVVVDLLSDGRLLEVVSNPDAAIDGVYNKWAFVEVPSGPSWEKCHDDAERAAHKWVEDAPLYDAVFHTPAERLVGFGQTVGGQHYA
jgi:hypothetical protein